MADEIKRKVLRLLAERGLTQQELAKRIGMSQAGLSHVINGHRRWDMEKLNRVAAVLDVKPSELIGDISQHTTKNRVIVEFSPIELAHIQRLADKEMRSLDNYIRWVLLKQVPNRAKRVKR